MAALLLPAMKVQETLEIPAPVSPRLLHSTHQIQALYKSWDHTLGNVRVKAPARELRASPARRPLRRGLFFSCGVDSYYSLFKNLKTHPQDEETITDLIVVRGFDLPFRGPDSKIFQTVVANARTVSKELQLHVLPAATNVRDFGARFVRWDRLHHGAGMASVGLALENVFSRIYIASSFSYSPAVDPLLSTGWGSHPAMDPLWSTERLSFLHDGCYSRRLDKLRFIVQFPIVMNTLRVCTFRPFSGDVYNCGLCEKCLRTIVGLHIARALQRCRTLPHSMDLRMLETIPIAQEVKVFTQELVDDLSCSQTDLAIRSALEKALSASAKTRSGRGLLTPFFSLAAYTPPLLRMWVRLWRALRRSPPSSIFDLFHFRR